MPKADGTPCKHNCKDKTACTHTCCKDTEEPTNAEGRDSRDNNDGSGPPPPIDFSDDEGSEDGEGTVTRRKNHKRSDDASSEGEEHADSRQFAITLGQTLAPLLAAANNPEVQVTSEIMKHKIRVYTDNPLAEGDIYDAHKITAQLRSTEDVCNGDNYFASAKMLESGFPDRYVRTLCSIATRKVENNGQKSNVMMSDDWYTLCQEILIKLIGSAAEVTNAASRWFEDCKPRAPHEPLEFYHARFKDTLEELMWIRECFDKAIDGQWMIKKLEKFINNLNSEWATLMVLNMPETHTLQQIFTQLQKMARSASLDKTP